MRQIKRTCKQHITEIIGANGTSYLVRINRVDLKLQKSFLTYTEAEYFLNNIMHMYSIKHFNKYCKEYNLKMYPENVIEILELDPADVLETFDERAKHILKETEYDMFYAYFSEMQPLRKIGKIYNLTEGRIGQIVSRAIRKLKYNKKFILLGEYVRPEELARIKHQQYLEEMKDVWTYESALEYIKTHNPSSLNGGTLNIHSNVEDLNFSLRTSNCLKRAGIKTINDLLMYTKTDLMRINNLGRKSLKEIINTLQEFNLTIKGD